MAMLKYFFCGVIIFATKLETKCNILNQVNHALLQTMFTVHALTVAKGFWKEHWGIKLSRQLKMFDRATPPCEINLGEMLTLK